MLNIASAFANANPPSAAYPGGSFKNSSGASTGDGTPLDQAWANDFLGFFQALLAGAGMTASGVSDTALVSQALQALKIICSPVGSTIWSPVWSAAPRGYLVLEGGLMSNTGPTFVQYTGPAYEALYSLLWAASTRVINGVTAGWQAPGASAAADWDAANALILPDMRGNFPEGWDHGIGVDPGRTLGSYQDDAIQNITGTFGANDSGQTSNPATGAFMWEPAPSGWEPANGTGDNYNGEQGMTVTFDASRVVRTANVTRPRSVAGLWVIKY